MIVVSDTSPLRALQALGRADLLQTIYGQVLVPPAVAAELAENAPGIGPFLVSDHAFLSVQMPRDAARIVQLRDSLDIGESQALALALEVRADTVLIDEARGRRMAASLGLKTVGVLAILVQGKKLGLIGRVGPLVSDLESRINFRVSSSLKQRILDDAGE